ncbi:hypothetical protein ANCCAN_09077 [Ancylostoma caninum]|uniref:Uncharacterized protein n=1 Tax=Ancylostoma caninum TaxID=29170 RepID=A0A368GKH7_ANCCA|nr:hypothetical protein ANCCAN_09077 [Ancylostoma caninum]
MWANRKSNENIDTVLAVLHALAELLSYRCNKSVRRSILMEFFRCMAVHGIPFRYLLESRASKYLAREEYNEKYPPSMNIKQFFCDLSKLEYGLRSSIWSFHTIQMGTAAPQMRSPLVQRRSSLQSLRYQLCMASRKLNYRAVVAQLGNSEVVRMTSETIEKRIQGWREINYQVQKMIYFDSPVAFFMILQSTLAMKHRGHGTEQFSKNVDSPNSLFSCSGVVRFPLKNSVFCMMHLFKWVIGWLC